MKTLQFIIYLIIAIPCVVMGNISILSTSPTLPNQCTGSITILADGDGAPYQITLNGVVVKTDVIGVVTLVNICEGAYNIEVADEFRCKYLFNGNIVSTLACTSLTTALESQSDKICEGQKEGYINLSTSGGNPPYRYLWSNGKTSEDIFNLGTGNYSVTVTDFAGCTTTNAFYIDQEIIQININPSGSSGAINGACNGRIDISIAIRPEQVNYTTVWSNGSTKTDINGLCTGLYTLTVTSENGCTKEFSQTINNCGGTIQPLDIIDFDLSQLKDCKQAIGGAITVKYSGGIAPYSFRWEGTDPDNPFYYSQTSQSPIAMNIIHAGTYTVTITDGCFNSVTKSIYAPCACEGWGSRILDISQVKPCISSGSKLIFNSVCWSSNIQKPNPFDFKITWPNLQVTTVSVTNFALCAGSDVSTYTTSGTPTTYNIPSGQVGNYFVFIEDEYGCTENRCFSFNPLTEHSGLDAQKLKTLEGNFFDNETEVYTGCFTCKSCIWGCNTTAGACESGLVRKTFEYTPQDIADPCTNAQIVCMESNTMIIVPSFVHGDEFIHWGEQIPSQQPGVCLYEGACYFSAGILDGVPDDKGVYVETIFSVESSSCDPPPNPPCVTINSYIYPDEPCYYDVVCSGTGEVLSEHIFDADAIGYCKQPINPQNPLSLGIYRICYYDPEREHDILIGNWYQGLPMPAYLEYFASEDVNDEDGDGNTTELNFPFCDGYQWRPSKSRNDIPTNKSIQEVLGNDFILYPNPFNSALNIKVNHKDKINGLTLQITDLTGRTCYRNTFDSQGNGEIITLNLENQLADGAYFVSLLASQKIYKSFIVVKNTKN
jgi:hypothetical protein